MRKKAWCEKKNTFSVDCMVQILLLIIISSIQSVLEVGAVDCGGLFSILPNHGHNPAYLSQSIFDTLLTFEIMQKAHSEDTFFFKVLIHDLTTEGEQC